MSERSTSELRPAPLFVSGVSTCRAGHQSAGLTVVTAGHVFVAGLGHHRHLRNCPLGWVAGQTQVGLTERKKNLFTSWESNGRKYLFNDTHSMHFIYGHMVRDHSYSESGNMWNKLNHKNQYANHMETECMCLLVCVCVCVRVHLCIGFLSFILLFIL